MSVVDWHDIDSIARIMLIIIMGVCAHLWINKQVISYKIAKWVIIIASLLTGIPGGIGLGWIFSLIVTLLQTSVLYFIVEMANKEAKEKQQGEKNHTDNKDRIL